jgi:hypothetical protein
MGRKKKTADAIVKTLKNAFSLILIAQLLVYKPKYGIHYEEKVNNLRCVKAKKSGSYPDSLEFL